MGKKQFFIGLVTGVLISAFLGAVGLSAKIIYDNLQEKAEVKQIAKEREETAQNVSDQVGSSTSVLTDGDFLKKVMLMENMIDLYYIEDVSSDDIKEGIYDGIMASIDDPYACYYTEDELKDMTQDMQGIFYGIGAVLTLDSDYSCPRITGIIADSPASESELRIDDLIVEVDGTDVVGMDLTEAVDLIKGPENTDVTLTVYRKATSDELEITITRRKVETPSVTYEMLEDNIAYIAISEFDNITSNQFKTALDDMKSQGMKALILDLRGNHGGVLGAAVDIANEILPKGIVVYTEDKYGKREEYSSTGDNELEVPMVVLINGESASASEILAGAIKDYGTGTLMGTTSFGKGIVQRVVGLGDGSAIKLTVSHYYTPLGNDIHKVGIEPDIEVEFDIDAYLENVENDNQKEEAIKYLKEQF